MDATIQTLTPTRAQRGMHAHTYPLDSVLIALEETPCPWCEGLLQLLLKHLERDIPVDGRAN